MVANRNALKAYAPQARKDFIQAMTNRAAQFGITKAGNAPGEERGELFIIGGKAFPRSVAEQRRRLIGRIQATSFDQTMEAVAYTWFNRFLAIRYMERHGYFDHGYRVLSHPAGETEPEILQQAQHLTLPGLDPDVVVDLKLQGNQDEALYRRILVAQCNDLHRAMPFLFERIDDETELLLPENLLQSDSIVRKLVGQIAESEWDEIEIIGWLYQFYISEKKEQVIGKVVKSEDIPAATQLFTPNWIVKYMVQNSLGAQWLATYPDSPLKAAMAYYIEPAEQTPEVQAQLDVITRKTLDPEAITLIDPAVGSGHILVEAYDLFRAIYIERGYTPQAAARAILTKNLYGLDIDDRAAQMAGFALLMKARADDRTLLTDPPTLNVMSLTDSGGWDAAAMADALMPRGRVELLPPTDLLPETLAQPTLSVSAEERGVSAAIAAIVALFNGAKTYGSLITVPDAVMESLPGLEALLAGPLSGDLLLQEKQIRNRQRLATLIAQTRILGSSYTCVVANPPYMGGKYQNSELKIYLRNKFPDSFSDTYTSFVDRNLMFCDYCGFLSMITLPSWMSLPTHAGFRAHIFDKSTLMSLIDNGRGVWGPDFGSCCFTLHVLPIISYKSNFKKLYSRRGEVSTNSEINARFFDNEDISVSVDELRVIPGAPLAYWTAPAIRRIFKDLTPLSDYCATKNGMTTGDNERFLRMWFEPSISTIEFDYMNSNDRTSARWVPYSKGGQYRKWFGNNDLVINWKNDGSDLASNENTIIRNSHLYFLQATTWSLTSMLGFGARFRPAGFTFDVNGMSVFSELVPLEYITAILNTSVANACLEIINPTIAFQAGDVSKIPFISDISGVRQLGQNLIDLGKNDWDSYETSWGFKNSPLIVHSRINSTLASSYASLLNHTDEIVARSIAMEEQLDEVVCRAYGLEGIIEHRSALSAATLTCNPLYRYGGDLAKTELEAYRLSDTLRELVSYGVGLMMGRYSLAEPGLIYANAGNEGFDAGRYGPFPADDDGIVPITEESWFADDAATRIEQFLAIAWPKAPINETLFTLTDGLTQGKGGQPRAALRAYLAKTFYKDHLQTYRNRPIYWLFSSGKQKAFECLVYLHRYNESTLARMRTAYVTPLMGKMQQRISDLDVEIAGSVSSAEKTRKGRDRDRTVKQLAELRAYDEELRHLADQRIALDLDDGVKVNYGRFGTLLAAKDKVCGKDNDKDD